MTELQSTQHASYHRCTLMFQRIPVMWSILFACIGCIAWSSPTFAESKSAFAVVLVDGHESMANSNILEPTSTFIGQFGTKSMDDVLGVWRVHSSYKNLKMRFVIDAREKLMDETLALEFDGTTRLLGQAIRSSNDYITADPDPNRVRIIVLIHGGGNDGESSLLSEQLKRAKEANVVIHTVAVGKKADRSLLKKISSKTSGRYFQVKDGADLSTAMTPIMQNIDRARDGKPLLAQEKYRKKKPKKKRKKKRKKDEDDDRNERDLEDEDEDEDEDDESKKKKDSGSLLWLWILLILLILAGGGVGLFFLLRKKPEPAVAEATVFPGGDPAEHFNADAFFAGENAPAPSVEPAAPAPRAQRPSPSQNTGGSSIVVFEPTTAEGERFEMGAAATMIRVGRKGENNIQLVHRGVSGRHAEIRWIDGRVQLKDLQSTNGTFVNGKRISEVELRSGDELRFDAVGYRVIYGAKAAPMPKPAAMSPPAQERTMMLSEEELASLAPPPEEKIPVANDFEAQEPELDLAHMYCMRHKNRIAQQSCDMCNRPYCSECLNSVLDQQICFRCRTQGTEG